MLEQVHILKWEDLLAWLGKIDYTFTHRDNDRRRIVATMKTNITIGDFDFAITAHLTKDDDVQKVMDAMFKRTLERMHRLMIATARTVPLFDKGKVLVIAPLAIARALENNQSS